jgi:biopolymer transport protein ExbD
MQSAVPMPKGQGDVLFLNVARREAGEAQGVVHVLGEPPMRVRDGNLNYWLQKRNQEAKESSKDGKNHVAIVLRADKGAAYGDVYEVLLLCKKNDFRKFNVRGVMAGGGGER